MPEQREPVKRLVALKLTKAGMDSEAVLARFEAERQALALMDHPHIAKVLDGGTTEQGRPYFVMELVKGLPLTEYCDARRLSVPERLKLFVQVCAAVQHAYQKGIIHRDLKPANIGEEGPCRVQQRLRPLEKRDLAGCSNGCSPAVGCFLTRRSRSMFAISWFRSRKSARGSTPARRRKSPSTWNRSCLRLERLEDRTVPSTFLV